MVKKIKTPYLFPMKGVKLSRFDPKSSHIFRQPPGAWTASVPPHAQPEPHVGAGASPGARQPRGMVRRAGGSSARVDRGRVAGGA